MNKYIDNVMNVILVLKMLITVYRKLERIINKNLTE